MSKPTKPRSQKKPVKRPSITDSLREAINASGVSCYQLAADSSLDVSSILRFKNGDRSLTLESVDRLAAVLGLRLK